jgi:type I restriction enzyme M protein
MVTSMAPKSGRLAVVLPHGALFRMGAEGKIRSKVLELDLVEAVIGLGANLFYGTGLAACIVVARRGKTPERKRKVLLVDGSDLFRKGRNQNTLESEHAAELFAAYRGFADLDDRARVVHLDDILGQGGNLSIAGYIAKADGEMIPTVTEAAASLRAALEAAWGAEDRLNVLLAERGIG